ncbi:MAG: HAD family hydrolase [Deltaproteobacteria bacterium]|nr:HAD family hydrolase [Deltaproteobacteria bacterium]
MSAPAPRALRAILFDFDHTLTDFGRWVDWAAARSDVMELYRAEGLDPERVTRRSYAFGLFVALDEALAARASRVHADGIRDRALAILEHHEHTGAARADWLRGAAALLELAADRDIALGIVSANGEAPIRAALARLGAADRFGAVLGRSPLFPPKPAPDMHREALRRLGVDAASALGVGDSPNDMRAARAADILTVGVLGGEGSEERLFQAGAAWVVEDLTVLPALLELWTSAV